MRRACFCRLIPLLAVILSAATMGPARGTTTTGAAAANEKTPLTVTYIGNEGFLLEAGGRKVLVDALVRPDRPVYVEVSAATRRKLEAAEAPFDDVDLVLATHHHGDHFDPRAVGRHLAASPRAVFVSTPQARAELARSFADFEAIADRVRAPVPAPGERVSMPELGLAVLDLHHGRDRDPPVENRGFVIELGGWTLLHVGDTEATRPDLAPFRLAEVGIDLAFLPDWFLAAAPWEGLTEELVRPRRIVVIHLPPGWDRGAGADDRRARQRVDEIRLRHPDALVFRRELEAQTLQAPHSTP